MAKYSYEFKKKIVDAYLRGEGGYKYLSSVYGPHKKIYKNGSITTSPLAMKA